VFLLSSYQQLSTSAYIQLLFWAFLGTLQSKTYDPAHGNLTAWNSMTPITVFLQTACLGFLQKSVETSQLWVKMGQKKTQPAHEDLMCTFRISHHYCSL
jgi:hypothetical protein